MRIEIVVAVENLCDTSEIPFNAVFANHLHATSGLGLFHRMIHSLSGSGHELNKWLGSDPPRL
jgi:hypothetical protein